MKTPPSEAHPPWTQARLNAFIRSGLRNMWSRWPPKYQVLAAAKRKSKSSNKRLKWEFQCACCSGWFQQKEVSVDHIVPAGKLNSFADIGPFVERLLVSVDKLQVLCHECHKAKTARDRAQAVGVIEYVKPRRNKHDSILESLASGSRAPPDVLPAEPRARKVANRKPKRKRS